ncbi:hypothetical protein [Flavobacterium sp. UBA7680]|uniref:hypothetical protein n=1 Tax=Flavobacterium sp. UBA7680 TaxID=1946559 RepID=UPI0025BA6FEC|nr:hypothetical protein [Flavobacterium sp. UBA7680]
MKNNTENDYRNAIKAKYEIEKSGDFHGFLENPSPAQLREFCLLKFDNGLNKIDEAIFRIYFKVNETENLREAIYNYHIPKFKSVQSFLIEENKKTNIQNLNLIAVLVDFNPRPYNKFSKGDSTDHTNDIKTEDSNALEVNKEIDTLKNRDTLFVRNPIGVPIDKPKSSLKKKVAIGICTIVFVFSVGYTTKQFILPAKECMQWQNDHYELVDCNSEINSLYSEATIEPKDEKVLDLKKIEVCDTTTFFRGEKAVVWYCKINADELEYFNGIGDGHHPILDKALHPITKHMIEKYVKK